MQAVVGNYQRDDQGTESNPKTSVAYGGIFRAAGNTHDPAALQLANLSNRCAYGASGGGGNQRFALFRQPISSNPI